LAKLKLCLMDFIINHITLSLYEKKWLNNSPEYAQRDMNLAVLR